MKGKYSRQHTWVLTGAKLKSMKPSNSGDSCRCREGNLALAIGQGCDEKFQARTLLLGPSWRGNVRRIGFVIRSTDMVNT